MNNATLEHLLQIATPPRDAGQNATRPRSDAPPFDSLFRQASEPQSRTERSRDSAPTNSPPSPAPRPNERQAAPQNESTTTQDSAARSDSEYATDSAAARDQQDEAEREELESTDAVAVAVVAVQESIPTAEPTAELAVVEEVEQAIDAAAESNTDSQPKPDGKPTPVEDSLIEVPTTTAAKETPAGESTAVEETAVVETEATTGEQVEATAKVTLTSPDETAPAPDHETKGKARAAAKNREADATKDSASIDQPVTEQAVEHREIAANKEITADSQPALEATAAEPARVDAEARTTVARAESTNTDQPATANSNRDQAPAPVRPTAAVSAPIAANVQQQTQAAATTNTTAANTVDATTKTDAARTKDTALSPFARLERNQTGASRGANGANQSQSAHQVDPARFVSRVARAIHTAQERGAPLQLRLSPPELGAMRIELSVNQGNLTATIETDNSSARQVLLENLPALRERLAEQNVKIERFDVDVRRDPTGQQNSAAQQQHDQAQQDRAATRGQSLRNSTNQTTTDEPAPVRRTITTSSINVIA